MAAKGGSAVFEAVVPLGLIVMVVITATTILAFIRRRMRASTSQEVHSGFDLTQLRRLRDGGLLTTEEHDNLFKAVYADPE